MKRWLSVALLALLGYAATPAAPAAAQGCGSNNPSCIVPMRPPGDNTDAAASTRWVLQNAGGGGGAIPSGTVGGMLYYTTTTSVASSPLLQQFAVVLGGGGVIPPSSVNGTGNTGQVLTSNGSLAAPTWQNQAFANITGTATFAQLPQTPGASLLGGISATPGAPLYITLSTCNGATNALTWTTGTGFGCNSIATGGTVTNFTAGALSPLFTTSVATATTTPALTFAQSNSAANTWFGNQGGSAAAPVFNVWPSCSGANQALNYTLGTGVGCVTVSGGGGGVTSFAGRTGAVVPQGPSPGPADYTFSLIGGTATAAQLPITGTGGTPNKVASIGSATTITAGCATWDTNLNLTTTGVACGSGGGGATPGTPVQAVQFNAPLGTFAGSGNFLYNDTTRTMSLGSSGAAGIFSMPGTTSGTVSVSPPATGGGTLTWPAGNDTIIARASTDTLTNKTYDTAGTGNVFRVNGNQISAITGTGGTPNKLATVGSATTLTSGNCAQFDANLNLITTSAPCSTATGTVTTFSAGTLSPLFTTSVATASTTPALSFSLSNAAANTLFGNWAASAAAPQFNAVPSCSGTNQVLNYTSGTGIGCVTITPGTGTVTTFSAGTLSPIFTTSVATASTTPALSFTLSNVSANQVLAGPTTGAAAAPTYRALVAADLPSGTPALIAAGTAALGTTSIGSAACATAVAGTATSGNAANILTTDVIQATFNGDPTGIVGYQPSTNGMLTIIPYPTAGAANFKVCNNTNASITPGAITLNWRVSR